MESSQQRDERLYGSGSTPRQDYSREDTRWEQATPGRDWAILIVAIALHTAWMLAIYLLEPGIR